MLTGRDVKDDMPLRGLVSVVVVPLTPVAN